jgi:hypothetical protein
MILNSERKYVLSSLDQFVFPDAYSRELIMAYASGELDRPLLISGGSGCGKSVLQRLLPQAIEGKKASVRKLRCADLKSANDVYNFYEKTKYFCADFKDEGQRYNYFIIEEFLLTTAKMNDALKIALDESLGIDMTILSTNRLEKVDPGIKSRCELLELKPCLPATFFPFAKNIFTLEGKEIDDGYLMRCLQATYAVSPDNRKYFSAIDSLFRKI